MPRHGPSSSTMSSPSPSSSPSSWRQRHFTGGILRSGGSGGGGGGGFGSSAVGRKDAAAGGAGRLRARERYWRRDHEGEDEEEDEPKRREGDSHPPRTWIVPDATSWRMYLPLLHKLVLLVCLDQEQPDGEGDDRSPDREGPSLRAQSRRRRIEIVLLESAVELMDERNRHGAEDAASTSVRLGSVGGGGGGGGALSERNALLRLVQRKQLRAFADLSVRDWEDDEWDWLGYEGMTTEERCRHAGVRAGRMLLQRSGPSPASSSSSTSRVHLVVSDPESVRYLDHVPMDDGMCVVDVEQLVELLVTDEPTRAQMIELAASCRNAYCERRERRMRLARGASIRPNLSFDASENEQGLTPDQIQVGLRAGRLKRGRLEVSRDNPREAFVATPSGTYFVDVRGGSVRAFHRDVVIVQELPKPKWGRPSKRIMDTRDDDDDDDADAEGDSDTYASAPAVPTATIVAVDNASRRIFVATQVEPPRDTDSHVLLVPMDIRVPKIRVPAKSYYAHQRLKVQVDGWDADSNYPAGRCLHVIGPVGDLETEVASLLVENQVDLDPFSTAALACLPATGDDAWTVPADEVARRTDVRTTRIVFSVDPPGCQDIDDSMHAHVLPNGDVEVGVHIADVTHWVRHNSPLDLEAQARGTTFYLVDRRYDMLPTLLSSNLCSLHGQTDRLAVSVIWTYSPDLKRVKSTWFGRTVIHNRAAMTYDQADRILQGKNPDSPNAPLPPPLTAGGPVDRALIEPLRQSLTILTRLARTLRKEREDVGGAVDLSSGDLGNELKFTIVDGIPTEVMPKVEKEIHHTIAELMILANTTVADKIWHRFPESALLRIHRSVDDDRFGELREVLEAYGVSFQGSSNAELAATLKQASRKHPTVDALLKSFATRAMSEAQYVCTGDISNMDDLSHYGLGLKKYTHFTSPIRRYADVVVHKQLLAALDGDEKGSAEKSRKVIPPALSAPTVALPESNVVSILLGEGLEGDSGDSIDDILDSLIEGASDLALQPKMSNSSGESRLLPEVQIEGSRKPYVTSEVTQICEGLNLHNRLAKYSSSECQKLFLSLYFRDHYEVTQAVVLKLRSNGFWCYIPKFDLRAPVYVLDKDDRLQVDPALLGLPSDEGMACSEGFAAHCRLLPHGRCELSLHPDEALVISVPEKNARIRVRKLDVVSIQLACMSFDLRARVPSPRAYLLANSTASVAATGKASSSQQRFVVTSNHFQPKDTSACRKIEDSAALPGGSFFQLLSSMTRRSQIAELLNQVEPKAVGAATPNPLRTITGRLVFGNFVNPNSRSARQAELQKLASADSAQRRLQVQEMASRRGEYDATSRLERDATSRQHRLVAEKRNARRSKAT